MCNFVVEWDRNPENLGLSSIDLSDPNTHLSKIDFDQCRLAAQPSKEGYESNICTTFSGGIYKDEPTVQLNEGYKKEKLYARLKLSMLTKPLLQGLAAKSFISPDGKEAQDTVAATVKRSDIALNLFWEHPYTKQSVQDNPQLLKQCYQEMAGYIAKHFQPADQKDMMLALNKRVLQINTLLAAKLQVQYAQPDLPVEFVEQEIKTRNISYAFFVNAPESGRAYHAFTADTSSLAKDSNLKSLKGDHLKSQILIQLKAEIEFIDEELELDLFINRLKDDPRYKILEKGQGITTRLFHLTTSSIKAFNELVEQRRAEIRTVLSH